MPAHILREADRATVRFSYDADVVGDLKVRIPSRFRTWDPDEKSWIVREPWVGTAINLMTERFGSKVSITDRRPGAAEPPRAKSSPGPDENAEREIRRLRDELARANAARVSAERRAAAASSAGSRGSSPADWAGELYRRLPAGMRDTVYKRLLTSLHPDVNNAHPEAVALTKELNSAFRAPKSGR
jgi:hypothetical protein